MAISDVKVTIDVQEPTRLLGFGNVVILSAKDGGHAYKEYYELAEVEKDFANSTDEYKMAKAILDQDNAPEKVAVYCVDSATSETLADGLAEIYNKDFYFIVMPENTPAKVLAVAAKLDELKNGKIIVTRVADTTNLATYKENTVKYENLVIFYHEVEGEYPDAALVGQLGSLPVGSITWKAKTLKNITADEEITKTELINIHEAGAIAYVVKAGDKVTSEGITHSGEYIDVVHSKDYLINNIQYAVQKQINKSEKIPYTNTGIASLEAVVISVLQQAFTQGIIAETKNVPEYTTNFPDVSHTTEADRKDRKYELGTFEFRIAGAIHTALIKGTLTY